MVKRLNNIDLTKTKATVFDSAERTNFYFGAYKISKYNGGDNPSGGTKTITVFDVPPPPPTLSPTPYPTPVPGSETSLSIPSSTADAYYVLENTYFGVGGYVDIDISQDVSSYLMSFEFGLTTEATGTYTETTSWDELEKVSYILHNHNGWQAYYDGTYSGGALANSVSALSSTLYGRVTRTEDAMIRFEIFEDSARTMVKRLNNIDLTKTKATVFDSAEGTNLYFGAYKISKYNGGDNPSGSTKTVVTTFHG